MKYDLGGGVDRSYNRRSTVALVLPDLIPWGPIYLISNSERVVLVVARIVRCVHTFVPRVFHSSFIPIYYVYLLFSVCRDFIY